jgi:hypothetical protein
MTLFAVRGQGSILDNDRVTALITMGRQGRWMAPAECHSVVTICH